jgi:membrane protein YqaA with SNARE-associated domain
MVHEGARRPARPFVLHETSARRARATRGRLPCQAFPAKFRFVPVIDPASPFLAILTAIATGFAVGILPVGLAEVAAVAIGVVQPPTLALTMLAAFTLAHVAAKLPWYALGTLVDRVRHPRAVSLTTRARALVASHASVGSGLLFASAFVSLPPFHLAAIAAGIVRLPLTHFIVVCLAGRALRFGLLASAPSLVRAVVGAFTGD